MVSGGQPAGSGTQVQLVATESNWQTRVASVPGSGLQQIDPPQQNPNSEQQVLPQAMVLLLHTQWLLVHAKLFGQSPFEQQPPAAMQVPLGTPGQNF